MYNKEFSITEGKFMPSFFEKYDFEKIMRRSNASDIAYSAGDKVYPPALEYVVFGAPKDAPEIKREIPEGLEIRSTSAPKPDLRSLRPLGHNH